ncbi:hypothetical protein [Nannocystis punicea]|uniref:TubC N-terminal docking domain-containing protein n=1 Tax=Nannocystis punicea TaxID=2995304 RepID=A0ABY7HII4_9BACT|nr:hypothetical protein [Nannocystis poenicansa]WAS98870.1 hypothetical protein O0S08_22295 [Nannocystis poenicansa]
MADTEEAQGARLRRRLQALGWRREGEFLVAPLGSMHLTDSWFAAADLGPMLETILSRRDKLLRIRQRSPADAQVSLDDVEPLIAALREVTQARSAAQEGLPAAATSVAAPAQPNASARRPS